MTLFPVSVTADGVIDTWWRTPQGKVTVKFDNGWKA